MKRRGRRRRHSTVDRRSVRRLVGLLLLLLIVVGVVWRRQNRPISTTNRQEDHDEHSNEMMQTTTAAAGRHRLLDRRDDHYNPTTRTTTSVRPAILSPSTFYHHHNNNNSTDMILRSRRPDSYFEQLQLRVDTDTDVVVRCARYGYNHNHNKRRRRNIWYGTVLGPHAWLMSEVLDIVAAETYGVFAGMVVVMIVDKEEAKETNEEERRHQQQQQQLLEDWKGLFGVSRVVVREYYYSTAANTTDNTDPPAAPAATAIDQAAIDQLIHQAWKEDLHMQADDLGYIRHDDQTTVLLTRDYLRALQECELPLSSMDHPDDCLKLLPIGQTLEYVQSPECSRMTITDNPTSSRQLTMGRCIGLEDASPSSLSSIRRTPVVPTASPANDSPIVTSFGFRKFANPYQHKVIRAIAKSPHTNDDDNLWVRACVEHTTSMDDASSLPRSMPIYFYDVKYRQRKHALVRRTTLQKKAAATQRAKHKGVGE